MSTTYTLQRSSTMENMRVHLKVHNSDKRDVGFMSRVHAILNGFPNKRDFVARARSLLNNTEERLDGATTKRSRTQLLTLAGPLFLCMTFIEDGLRVPLAWSEQYRFMTGHMNYFSWFAVVALVASMVTQLVGSFLVMRAGGNVKSGARALIAFTAIQPFLYGQHLDLDFVSRSLTLAGGLLFLVWAEDKKAGSKLDMFSMSRLSDSRSSDSLQLAGRLLLTFLFLFQAVKSEHGGLHTVVAAPGVLNVLGFLILTSLSLMTCVGFKTEWSSIGLTAVLGASAVWMYPFWTMDDATQRDFSRYYFFQTVSMMGGMMLLTLHGPGGLSLDGSKKAI